MLIVLEETDSAGISVRLLLSMMNRKEGRQAAQLSSRHNTVPQEAMAELQRHDCG